MTLAGGSGFQLQWGRDQLIAELEYSGLKPQTQAASMGPRSIDRGIRGSRCCPAWLLLLQWGRDQLIAEFGRRPS